MSSFKIEVAKRVLMCFCLSAFVGCVAAVPISNGPTVDQIVVVKSYSDPGIGSTIDLFDPDATLFVFDVDNTLLESPTGQFLASDQWYKWQKGLADDDPAKVTCPLDIQGLGYSIAHLKATEGGESTNFVRRIQEIGFDAIAMTARSPQFRSSTERELIRNGFEFDKSLPGDNAGFAGTYIPRRSAHNNDPRVASYQNGIAMLAGQHKGDSLLDLLDRLDLATKYKTVVFFDDDEKNTNAVVETFSRDSRVAFVVQYNAVNISLNQYDINETVESQDLIEELYDRFLRQKGCDI
jgi:hypothetical protein